MEEDRRANKDIELKTWRRNRAYSARQIFDVRGYSPFRERAKKRTFISPLFFLEQLFERSFLLNIKHDSKRFFSFIIAFPLTGEGIFINLVEFYVAIYLNARRIIEKKN